jgi:WD40 repeat protein
VTEPPQGFHRLEVRDIGTLRRRRAYFEAASQIYRFSPDGRLLVARQAGLWHFDVVVDAATGRWIHEFERETSLGSLTFSADGRLMATGDDDGSVDLWQTAPWKLICRFQPAPLASRAGHSAAVASPQFRRAAANRLVSAVALSTDGQLLVTGSIAQGVRLWDTATGTELSYGEPVDGSQPLPVEPRSPGFLPVGAQYVPLPYAGWLPVAAFAPDGALLAVRGVAEPNTIRLWEVARVTSIRAATGLQRNH